MDSRFLQWLVGGLFLILLFAFIAGQLRGEEISGLTITSCTTLIGVVIGALTMKSHKDHKNGNPPKDEGDST